MNFITTNSKKKWKKLADRRVEMPDYPERSVLEGLVNALIHRSYLELGSEVHIDMFDDRLEIYSPGGMYDGTKVQDRDIYNIPSKRRNPVIADIFNRLHFMERRGSGFKKICEDYAFAESYTDEKKPRFISDSDNFTLILPNLNYVSGELNGELNHQNGELNGELNPDVSLLRDNELLVYNAIKNNPNISRAAMIQTLPISARTIDRIIKNLIDNGFIVRVGAKKNGHWKIV